jgi:hypothetical protein
MFLQLKTPVKGVAELKVFYILPRFGVFTKTLRNTQLQYRPQHVISKCLNRQVNMRK